MTVEQAERKQIELLNALAQARARVKALHYEISQIDRLVERLHQQSQKGHE